MYVCALNSFSEYKLNVMKVVISIYSVVMWYFWDCREGLKDISNKNVANNINDAS